MSFDFNNKIKSATFWVSGLTFLSIPAAYLVSWILSKQNHGDIVVGYYALILLVIQLINTFCIFGGPSAISQTLPGLESVYQKKLIFKRLFICGLIFLLSIMMLVNFKSDFRDLFFDVSINVENQKKIISILPLIFVAQLIISFLPGLLKFRTSAILSNFQNLSFSMILSILFLTIPQVLSNNIFDFIFYILVISNVLIFVVGGRAVHYNLTDDGKVGNEIKKERICWKPFFLIHLTTIITFVYSSVDQLLVYKFIGISELGYYFLAIQCTQVIRLIPLKLGQVFLTSFSVLIKDNELIKLKLSFRKTAIVMMLSSCFFATILILTSRNLTALFGSGFSEKYHYIIILSLILNLGSLGPLNSMLSLAMKKNNQFVFLNLLLVIFQLVVTIVLINDLGVYGVLIGKFLGMLLGQIGLYNLVGSTFFTGFKLLFFSLQLFTFSIAIFYELNDSLIATISAALISILMLILVGKFYLKKEIC